MSDDDKNNVTAINSKKKAAKPGKKTTTKEDKKPVEKQDEMKIPAGTMEEMYQRFLENGVQLPYLKGVQIPWNIWFYREKNSDLSRIIKLNPENKTVSEIGKETLKGEIGTVFRRFANPDSITGKYCLGDRQISALGNRLTYLGRRASSWPKTTGFLSDPDYVFHRLPFDPHPEAVTPEQFPTINENISRMTNSAAFCQRVGSIFDLNANRKKIVMLLGESNGGKSALLDLITYIVGGVDCVATVNLGTFAQFGMATLLDKRVWIGNEINPKFFINDKFKTIADPGPSLVGIERKGQGIFNSYLNGMLFCSANPKKMPRLEDDSGLRSRLIFCEVEPIPESLRMAPDDLSQLFHTELPFFLRYCLDAYSEFLATNPGREIQSEEVKHDEQGIFDQILDEDEMGLEVIFNRYFYEDLTAFGRDGVRLTTTQYVQEWERITYDNPSFGRSCTKREFDNYVKKRAGTKKLGKQFRTEDKRRVTYIEGIRRKSDS